MRPQGRENGRFEQCQRKWSFFPGACRNRAFRRFGQVVLQWKIQHQRTSPKIDGESGFVGYLGINDMRDVKERIKKGDEKAALVYRAMALQVAKEIASYSATLEGKVDAIILTGGVVYDEDFAATVTERVQWIAPVLMYPGENEMKSLAENALRVLKGEEKAASYADVVKIIRKGR